MQQRPFFVALALILAAAPLAAHAEVELDEFAGFKLSFEGLIQADSTRVDDDVSPMANDSELRRAEIVLKGKAESWDWVIGYDASERNDKWLDVNARIKLASPLALTVGQFKQPNSMEELSSSKNNDFITKAAPTSMFGVGRRLGASLAWSENNWSLSGSAFGREITDGGGAGNGMGARATFAPINVDGQVLHLGLSAIALKPDNDSARLRARPAIDMSSTPRLIDTGTLLDADRQTTVGLESGWISGPLKLQGEYMTSSISRTDHADFSGDSWYLSALWNLSGEPWGYKGGVFTTSKPGNGGVRGMWQLGARYESANLDDGAVKGGDMKNLVLGVNWYYRSNLKMMVNYVKSDVTRPDGSSDQPSALEARAQFYW